MEGWWTKNGDPAVPIQTFVYRANEAGGIASKGRKTAPPDQLARAVAYERITIRNHCNATGKTLPRWL